MDSVPPPPPPGTAGNEPYSTVDPFLIEAVQNPRHRLTILRMELDIQKFFQNSDQQQFEFQHFPTSYLRLAAHRVAQHYGLQTMVQDNVSDGLGNRIVVKKLAESRYPAVCLSDVLAKQSENDKHDQVKIVMRPRCNKASNEASEIGAKRSPMRTVEERKEQYDRARARIFSSPSSPESEDSTSHTPLDGKIMCLNVDENEGCKNSMIDLEKLPSFRDAGTSSYRVAIFRDREKDRTDPDYDRSYERYVKTSPASQSFVSAHYNMQKFQPPFVQYDNGFPQLGQVLRTQASVGYRTPIMNPFCATGFNQTSRDAVYMQWPTSTMMYAESYDQFRRAVFQVPYSQQQPLSFDYSQNR